MNVPQRVDDSSSPMSETQSASADSPATSRGKADPAWEHIAFKKEGRTIVYTCLYCSNTYKGGGINRMKQHLAGVKGNIAACKKVSGDIRHQMLLLLQGIKEKKSLDNLSDSYGDSDTNEEVQEVQPRPTPTSTLNTGKRKASIPPDSFFAPRTTPCSQPTLRSVLSSKQAVHRAKMAIARWFFDSNLPFHATKSPYFQAAADAIAAIGPGFKVPSYHDMRVNLLGDCKKECQLLVESHRAHWAESGCTIMADGWSDQKQRTLINFLVYCSRGLVFVKSIDASDVVKDAATLCAMFSEVIEWVGPVNVVHVVTDNAANYVSAGKLIHDKYESIFWSPCAAHCLNLLLKDICSMSHVAELATKASQVTKFVYNHMVFLSWLRKREGWQEIVRPGVTRFATTFITLKSIYEHKHDLQALMVDKHFTSHKLAKTQAGQNVNAIILDSKFWNDCYMIAKLMGPVIKLLKIVDGDAKPSMGYVYDGMYRAKKAIKEMFRNRKPLYKKYTEIFKARWDKHLKRNLHATAYYLNPAVFYDDSYKEKSRVVESVVEMLEVKAICPNMAKAMEEMQAYRRREGSFGKESAMKLRKTMQPGEHHYILFKLI